MKAVRNTPPAVEVVEVDEPEGDGELVRVAAVGICGSDLAYLRCGSTQIAGHEFAGVLEVPGHLRSRDRLAAPGGFLREIALRPSLCYCSHKGRGEFAEAADMLASRPELPATLITHRFPIDDAAAAFRVAADKSKGVFKVVVEP